MKYNIEQFTVQYNVQYTGAKPAKACNNKSCVFKMYSGAVSDSSK